MSQKALFIGNSDGIGLATTRRLLNRGWHITGISRSESPIRNKNYTHRLHDVSDPRYVEFLEKSITGESVDLCIYFAGIGELLHPAEMKEEIKIFEVNLMGMVKTLSVIIPGMVQMKQGHFIGISSMADELLSAEAPSYHASKAGFSNYLEGLAIALKSSGVSITNIRFGFVDTKMAKGDLRPFMIGVAKAVDHIETCIKKRPRCFSAPGIVVPLIKFRKVMMKLGAT